MKRTPKWPKHGRRDFLKKNLLGSLLISSGLPFVSFRPSEEKTHSAKLPGLNGVEPFSSLWEGVRDAFLFEDQQIYLNTASLGPSPKVVVDEMCERLKRMETKFGAKGANGHGLESVYQNIADFFHTTTDQFAITRNTTEGMNIMANSLPLKAGDEVILTTHEHVGGASPWLLLQNEIGIKVVLVELDLSGVDNLSRIRAKITDRTKAVCFSHVCCTTGMILPAKEIVELCKENKLYSCVDGAQAAGLIKVDLKEIDPDFYAASGHKWLFGPKGTGIFFINNRVIEKIKPVFAGAYFDRKFDLNKKVLEYRKTARRVEYGTRNLPMIAGLGKAVSFVQELGIENIEARGKAMHDYLRNTLESNQRVEILSPANKEFATGIFTFRFKERDNLAIVKSLYQKPERIKLRGVYENDLNAIRVSTTAFTQKRELDQLLAALQTLD